MKKLKFLLVICAVAVLSGCCKFETKMVIDKDKKVDLEIIFAPMKMGYVEEEMMTTTAAPTEELTTTAAPIEEKEEEETLDDEIPTVGADDTETIGAEEDIDLINSDDDLDMDLGNLSGLFNVNCDDISTSLGSDWTVEKYSDNTYEGCKIKRSYASIDDISGENDVIVELTDILNGKFEGNQLFKKSGDDYSAHFKVSVSNLNEGSDQDISAFKGLFKMTYVVELPYKNLSNNATKVENDGKKLTWNINVDKDTEIKYSFNFKGKGNIPWLYIGIGAGALVLIIIICIVVSKGKKCDCSNCSCDKKEETYTPVDDVKDTYEPAVEETTQVTETVVEPVAEEAIQATEPVSEPVIEENAQVEDKTNNE